MFSAETHFLVVDDNRTGRLTLCECLKQLSFKKFTEAESGQQAMQILTDCLKTQNPIQFIFSDWNMPGMTGLDFLGARNQVPELKKIRLS